MDERSTTLSTPPKSIKHKIGRIWATITIVVPGEDPITHTAHGLVFGRLIILGRTT